MMQLYRNYLKLLNNIKYRFKNKPRACGVHLGSASGNDMNEKSGLL